MSERLTDEEYEARRLKDYRNDPPAAPAEKNERDMYAVEELIHHGNYISRRTVEVYALNEVTVDAIIQSSAYCYGSWKNPDVTYESLRPSHLEHLVQDLKEGRVNRSIGWSTFRVLPPLEGDTDGH